ncbi:hypothetical protein [Paenibacillus maysiensis]|uniref:hypothetical protein n=1 Tax=Paenibacillus maysiensis TaxID=1155954 RepID=UPI000471558B|nr:hypothetical protein [Paenibacillus maysiensis]
MTSNSSNRDELCELARRAEKMLESRGEFFTDGAKLALEDTLRQAKLALEDRAELPFERNREFIVPRSEEAIRFAIQRYTSSEFGRGI